MEASWELGIVVTDNSDVIMCLCDRVEGLVEEQLGPVVEEGLRKISYAVDRPMVLKMFALRLVG